MASLRIHRAPALALFCISAILASAQAIDRHALVTRHNIEVHDIDPNGAMAVGNGSFAFNFDVTGLQSFPTSISDLPAPVSAEPSGPENKSHAKKINADAARIVGFRFKFPP